MYIHNYNFVLEMVCQAESKKEYLCMKEIDFITWTVKIKMHI